jgi:hypothetical protein
MAKKFFAVRPKENARQRFLRMANSGFPVVWADKVEAYVHVLVVEEAPAVQVQEHRRPAVDAIRRVRRHPSGEVAPPARRPGLQTLHLAQRCCLHQ